MTQGTTLHEVVDAVENLPHEQQHALVGIFRRRLAEVRRQQLFADIEESRRGLPKARARP